MAAVEISRPKVTIIDGLLYAEVRAVSPVSRGHKGHGSGLKQTFQSVHIIRRDAPEVSMCRRRAPIIEGQQQWSSVSSQRDSTTKVCRECLKFAKRSLRRLGVREIEEVAA